MSFRNTQSFALCIVCLLLWSAVARSDETSGTWTGALNLRGDYYLERSTRVLAPSFSVEVESPYGVDLNATYLVDSITSASQAAGTLVDREFTEIRHEGKGTLTYAFDWGDVPIIVLAGARYSYEPDYESISAHWGGSFFLNQKATELRWNMSYVHDDVGQVLRGVDRVGPDGRDLSNRGRIGTLQAWVGSFVWEQVFSRNSTFQLGYDLGYVWGYQANPYRQVNVAGVLEMETHPNTRLRHTLYGRYSWYIPDVRLSLHAFLRYYTDSWDIGALTPEMRIYKEFTDQVQLRVRYRHYLQTPAFFFQPSYDAGAEYFTSDPKMMRFQNHLLGGAAWVKLGFLEETPLGFFSESTIELIGEYIWSNSRWGDGIIAQAAFRMPF